MSDLPPGWIEARLDAIAAVNPPPVRDLGHDDLVSFVPMAAVEAETGRLDASQRRSFSDVRGKSYRSFAEGDVLFAKVTPCMENGKIAIATGLVNGLGFGSSEFHVVRPLKGISGRFLLHYLLQRSFRDDARRYMSGTAGLLRVSSKFLEGSPIPVPPTAEQTRIVAAIEEEFSRLDTGAAALERARQNLKRMRAAVLNALLVDKSGQRWRTVGVDSVLVAGRYGTSTKCSYDGTGLPVLRIPNIQSGRITLKDLKRAIDRSVDLTGSIVEEGDVLIIRTNGSRSLIGRAAVVPAQRDPLSFASYLIQLKFDRERIDPRYLVAALSAPAIRQRLESMAATTAGQYNVSLDKLRSLDIPCPPMADQLRQVTEADRQISIITDLELAIDRACRREVQARSSILAAAFSGNLVPQAPSDEPASALLKRVTIEASPNGQKSSHGPKSRTTSRRVLA